MPNGDTFASTTFADRRSGVGVQSGAEQKTASS
jgi:hypothetical protein